MRVEEEEKYGEEKPQSKDMEKISKQAKKEEERICGSFLVIDALKYYKEEEQILRDDVLMEITCYNIPYETYQNIKEGDRIQLACLENKARSNSDHYHYVLQNELVRNRMLFSNNLKYKPPNIFEGRRGKTPEERQKLKSYALNLAEQARIPLRNLVKNPMAKEFLQSSQKTIKPIEIDFTFIVLSVNKDSNSITLSGVNENEDEIKLEVRGN